MAAKKKLTFEQQLEAVESLIAQMENGSLPLEVHTHSLGWSVKDGGGQAELCYHIRLGPQQSGRTELSLVFTPGGKERKNTND